MYWIELIASIFCIYNLYCECITIELRVLSECTECSLWNEKWGEERSCLFCVYLFCFSLSS